MAKQNKRTGMPQIWGQLLNYLNNDTPRRHPMSLHRLELLQLIAHTPQFDNSFYIKMTSLLRRSVEANIVVTYRQIGKDKKIISSNVEIKKVKKLLDTLPSLSSKKRSSSYHYHNPFSWTEATKLTSATLIGLSNDDEQLVITAIFSTEAPIAADIRLLDFLRTLIDLRKNSFQLSAQLDSQVKQTSTIIHHLSEGLVILDKSLTIKSWNKPLQRITGFSQNEVADRPYYEIIQKIDDPIWLETLKQAALRSASRHVFTEEFTVRAKHKGIVWIGVSGSFLINEKNEIDQVLIIVRDISRAKELENRKSEFISIATHELRTPITAIKGYLNMLEKEGENLSEKQALYLNRAIQANNRLVRLAEDLLQIVQTEENRLQFTLKAVDISPIITKVVGDLSSKAQKRNITVNFNLPNFKPIVAVDVIKFEQVVANLVDNAIKYTNKGGVTIYFVRSHNKSTNSDELLINIKDTGIGMTEAEMNHIFDKFHRTEAAQLGTETGAGLGLFIVKSFIEKQNGKISVRSRVRHGSVFTIALPLIEYYNDEDKNNG